jgi:cyclophilin family peptidyl-prolyl cis-trans isomerase
MISRRRALASFLILSATAVLALPASAQNTMVRWQTALGPIDIQLYDTAAPKTVANFLGYVNSGAYLNTFFHRSVPGFVVQGGGYAWPASASSVSKVVAGPAVVNEFSATRSNLRGTVAMAKLGGDPNSATTEWFVNLADNSSNLDNQNGGFTVFGKVTTGGMAVFDQIAALKIVNAGGAYTALPVINQTGTGVKRENLVLSTSVAVLPGPAAASTSDRVFNYLEGRYPQYLPLAGMTSGTALGYNYRYYPATNSYVGTQDGRVDYLVPAIDGNIHTLGSLADWLALAAGEGY